MTSQSIGLCSFLFIISWCFLHTKVSGENCYLLYGVEKKCFKCPVGYYGSSCTDVCAYCSILDYRIDNSSSTRSGTFCDSDTGKCIEGCEYHWYGDKCDERPSFSFCGSSGRDSNGVCQECMQGYYSERCTSSCSTSCKNLKCDREKGVCYECQPGYYGHYCRRTCKNCADGLCNRIDGICSDCELGFHGPNCNKTCGQCQPEDGHLSDLGRCNRVTSICDNGCRKGFQNEDCYKSDMGLYYYTLRSGSLHCSDCPVGTYGQNCEKACSSQCAMTEYTGRFCEKFSGKCFSCEDNWFGDRCRCNGFCDEKECNEKGYCYNCAAGYYGNSCLRQCRSSCDNNGCNRDGHCYKCLPGYYGRSCYYKCKLQCKYGRCNRYDGLCSECPTGLYGEYCNQTCGQCARVSGVTFETRRCGRYTGKCLSGCTEGYIGETCHESNDGRFCYDLTFGSDLNCFNCRVDWYGRNCDQRCHENCVVTKYLGKVCDHDSGECAKCENDWYGSKCDCRGHCNSEGCDKNGICFGCEFGYWGQQYCLLECSEGCDDEGCNEVNGLCYACGSKLYDNYCNVTCSNCHQNCNRITGACLDGCAVGFYGHDCGVNCSHCKYMHVDDSNIPCNLTSGYCKGGCVLGHYGLRCNKLCECDSRGCDRYTGACRDGYGSRFPELTSGTSPDLTKNENDETFKNENDHTFKNKNDDTYTNESDYTYIRIMAGAGVVTGFVILVFLIIITVISGRYAKTWRSVATGKQEDITSELDPLRRQEQHYDELNITRKAVDTSTNNVYAANRCTDATNPQIQTPILAKYKPGVCTHGAVSVSCFTQYEPLNNNHESNT